MIRLAVTALVASLAASPAVAQDSIRPARDKGDPNEIVCERFKVIGSRLATKTACATRQEWADRRRSDRQDIEKSQMNQCVVTGATRRC